MKAIKVSENMVANVIPAFPSVSRGLYIWPFVYLLQNDIKNTRKERGRRNPPILYHNTQSMRKKIAESK